MPTWKANNKEIFILFFSKLTLNFSLLRQNVINIRDKDESIYLYNNNNTRDINICCVFNLVEINFNFN